MRAEPAPARPWVVRRPWSALGLFVGVSVALTALTGWREGHALLINRTDSLPHWAFFVSLGATPHRGDYVSFLPPRHALVLRHFGGGREAWDKIVYGVPGDVVSHRGATVLVNGRPVGRMKPLTRFGEPLTPGATGPVPAGCYYAGTPHPDGFDSRYAEIGFVCAWQILGVGEPIL